jgi:hypothetical protein
MAIDFKTGNDIEGYHTVSVPDHYSSSYDQKASNIPIAALTAAGIGIFVKAGYLINRGFGKAGIRSGRIGSLAGAIAGAMTGAAIGALTGTGLGLVGGGVAGAVVGSGVGIGATAGAIGGGSIGGIPGGLVGVSLGGAAEHSVRHDLKALKRILHNRQEQRRAERSGLDAVSHKLDYDFISKKAVADLTHAAAT